MPLNAGLSEAEARRVDLVWAGGVTLAIALVFLLLKIAGGATAPVFVSLCFAYALNPVIGFLERRGVSRPLAIALLFVVVAVLLTGALLYLVPAVGAELGKLPIFVQDIAEKAVPRVEGLLGRRLPSNVRDAAQALSGAGGGFASKILPQAAAFALGALGGTASLLASIVGLLVIPVLTFYFLKDYGHLVGVARSLIPRRYEALVCSRFAEVDAVLGAFISGQLTVGAILSILYAAGLWTAKLELCVVIGAIAGFGTMIPYVGPAIGVGLALLSCAVDWQGPWQLAVIAVTFGGVMAIEGLVVTPRVVGERVGLSPLAVMVAILAFAGAFGFMGVLLAVPVTAAMKVVVRAIVERYRRTAFYRGTPT